MADVNKALKEDILEHAKKRANELLQQYSKLRMLYSEQDGLIGMPKKIYHETPTCTTWYAITYFGNITILSIML